MLIAIKSKHEDLWSISETIVFCAHIKFTHVTDDLPERYNNSQYTLFITSL